MQNPKGEKKVYCKLLSLDLPLQISLYNKITWIQNATSHSPIKPLIHKIRSFQDPLQHLGSVFMEQW